MHGCGWDSGAARERSSALPLAASVASRYIRARRRWRGRCACQRARAPVAAGSLPRATRSAPKAGALRARAPTCAPRVTAHVVSWGGVGMSKTSCAACCSRGCSVQGVLRAPAEGEGAVAHREDLAATASATLERSAGTVAHGKRAARRRSKVSRRRRAVGGACACRARSNGRRKPCSGGRWWWQQLRITSNGK